MGAFADKSCNILLALQILSCFIFSAQSARKFKENEPCKRLVLHLHNTMFNGINVENATSAAVANQTNLGPFKFRYFVVFDDPMTKDQNLLSPPVARAQGFYFYDMKSTYSTWMGYSLIFNSSEYKGSINIMGANMIKDATRDLSVVGGTGDFFMTRGIATLTTDTIQAPAYFRLQMDIKFV